MPSHEQQARFFTKLQHLLVEGEFVSTYKFALLIALARWAVENPGHDEGVPLDVGALAEHFVTLYWPQARPYGLADMTSAVAELRPTYGADHTDDWPGILGQDRGGQRPRIIKLILEEQRRGSVLLRDVPAARKQTLLADVRASIRQMPLWKLHVTRGRGQFRFLYRRGRSDSELLFEPGIVACLAGYALLVEEVVKAAWLRFVLRHNQRLLGTSPSQLEDFLFPSARSTLGVWRPVLAEFQGSQCFYCERGMRDAEVDHFLPWSRYPRDLGHNFVLAHPTCNGRKSDHLASVEHLERWCRRNEDDGARLAAGFDRAGLPHDWPTLRRVAGSLYRIAANAEAEVWRRDGEFVELDGEWRRVLGVG